MTMKYLGGATSVTSTKTGKTHAFQALAPVSVWLNKGAAVSAKKYLLFSVLLVLLSSCGFQLRERVSLPSSLQPVLVKAKTGSQTAALLRQRLIEQGVAVTATAKQAKLWIELSHEEQDERMVSVSTFSTTMREVELTYQVYLQLRKPDGKVLVEKRPLRLVREFIYNENEVLAKASEQQVLRDDMQQEILAHILRRLSHLQDAAPLDK